MTALPLKVEGLGNHFVLIDEFAVAPATGPTWPSLCAHGTGIGGDGLRWSVNRSPREPCVVCACSTQMALRTCAATVSAVSRTSPLPVCAHDEVDHRHHAGPREVQVDARRDGTVRASLVPVLSPADMPARVGEGPMIDQEFVMGNDRVTVSLVSGRLIASFSDRRPMRPHSRLSPFWRRTPLPREHSSCDHRGGSPQS